MSQSNAAFVPQASSRADWPLQSPVWAAIALVVLAVAVGLVYGPAADAPFVFDDFEGVVNNRSIHRLWPLFGDEATPGPLNPPVEIPSAGRPLVNGTLALNYAFGGEDPWSYHVVNLLLHLAACCILWALVRRTLALDFFAGRFKGVAAPLALVVALVWAVHPLATESVEYVSQRTELMMGLFYLATLYGSLRYFQAESQEGRIGWGCVAVALCMAGMACKEVMVSAPVMVLLYERTFLAGTFWQALKRSWPLYLGLASAWLVLFALNIAGPRAGAAGFHLELSAYRWWLTQAKIFFMYMKLAIWPWPLVIHYEVPYFQSLGEAWPWVAGVAAVVVVTAWLVWRRTAAGFLAAWVLVVLAPTHLVPMVTEVAAERRMYLPLPAIIALVMLGGYTLIRSLWRRTAASDSRGLRWGPLGTISLAGLLIAGLYGIVSTRRLAAYDDAITLWSDSAKHQPDDSYVNANLGIALLRAGKAAEAIPLLHKALESDKREAGEVLAALGTAYLGNGQLDQAIEHFQASLKESPNNPEANRNFGHALLRLGRPKEAVPYLERAVSIKPDGSEGWRDLGAALVNSGRVEEAIPALERALELSPDAPELHRNLGIALGNMGRVSEAVRHLERAVELKPDAAEFHQFLGVVLIKAGKSSSAVERLREAVRLAPQSADAHYYLGVGLLGVGQKNAAVAAFETAAKIDPNHRAASDLERLRGGR